MPLSFLPTNYLMEENMDEMKLKLSTFFMRGFAAKLLEDVIRKKTGKDIGVELNELEVSVVDGKTHIAINLDMNAGIKDIMHIIKSLT